MKITKQQLLKLVVKEADNLKKFATKKEINRLNINTLNPNNYRNCIYGQMTGDCFSKRAIKLLTNCNKVWFVNYSLGEIQNTIGIVTSYSRNFSPIENFIDIDKKNNAKLIDYIQGKRKTLVIKY